MPLTSSIRLLSKGRLIRVHDATLQVLERTGLKFKSEAARLLLKRHGAKVDGEVVRIPGNMVESALETAPPTFRWWARDPDPEKHLLMGAEQERPHISPNHGPIYIQDLDGGRRLGRMADLINLYKLSQASAVCDIAGAIPVAPSDIPPEHRCLQTTYQLLRNIDKPLIGFVAKYSDIIDMLTMVEIAVGRKGRLYDRPYIGVSVNPLSPLTFDSDACETMMTYAEYGQPVFVLSCALAGVSAPISLLGTLVVQNAEMLAGLVLTQLVNPGTPFVYSPASAVPNLATGSYVTGSPESNLINIAGLQLAREIYDLPCRSMAGLTDAHWIDCQAGYETMQNLMMLMLAGVHLINECLGAMGSIMTTSYEKFIIDEEMLSRSLRIIQGLSATEDSLSLDVIEEVGHNGSYLMHPSTVRNCRDAWKPTISFWGTDADWDQHEEKDILVRANQQYKKILKTCPESTLDPAVDRELQQYVQSKLKKR